jgi:hypothetical protein
MMLRGFGDITDARMVGGASTDGSADKGGPGHGRIRAGPGVKQEDAGQQPDRRGQPAAPPE